MSKIRNLRIECEPAFAPLLQPARYKAAYGGRGSGKSHFFAELMVAENIASKQDNVCLREVQKSLRFSVKKLLESKIEVMNAGSYFEVQDKIIKTKRGGVIIFDGLQNHTVESIKSLEDFSRAWVEEAQSLSQRSLDILRPTMRSAGSQMWFGWNPNFATDPVDQFFRGDSQPPNSITVKVGFEDNSRFPEDLKADEAWDRKRDPDKHAHVWLGGYQTHSEARVFRNWIIEEFDRPEGTVHRLGADWGYSIDPSVMVRCSIEQNRLYVDWEAYRIGCEIVNLPDLFMAIPEAEKWPSTADSSRPETIAHMKKHGFPKMQGAVKGPKSIEEGVAFLQSFDIVVHPRCKHVIDELTHYRYKTDPLTNEILPILEDKDNHCIAEGVLVTCERGDVPIEQVTTSDRVLTRGGFRRVLFAGQTDSNRETIEIGTTGGAVRCTPDHEIWTSKGFVRADALRYADEVISVEETQWSSALRGMVGSIAATLKASTNRIVTTFSGALRAERHGFIETCGSFTTAQSRQDLRSITLTEMEAITTSLTSRCYLAPSTSFSTLTAFTATQNSESSLSASDRSQRHGTPAMWVEKSIGKLGRSPISNSYPRKSVALTASNGLRPGRLGTWTSIAGLLAALAPAERPAWMTKCANALRAARASLRIALSGKRLVRAHVETLSAGKRCARVYDLTVEGHHEFFANGVLVSNCIDALRYACEGARRARPVRKSQPVVEPRHWAG